MASTPTVKTYNPKLVKIALGSHMASGYDENEFVQIEPHGDGTTEVVGADGEVNIAISPDSLQNITLTFLQNSPTNEYLENMDKKMRQSGDGFFPIMVKDMLGNELYAASIAWVKKAATWTRGKNHNNRQWTICGIGEVNYF